MPRVRSMARRMVRSMSHSMVESKWGSGDPVSTPVNTVLPVITGDPIVGITLSGSDGSWTNSPTSFTYQWKRDGVNIAGATSNTYTLVTADDMTTPTFEVTALNASGSGTAISNGVDAFEADFNISANDATFLFTDTAGTTNVSADADPVALAQDRTGNGYNYQQATSGERGTWRTDVVNSRAVIRTDGTNDNLDAVLLDLANNRGEITIFIVSKYDLTPVSQQIAFGITRTDTSASSRLAVGTDVDNSNYNAGGRRENSGGFDNAEGEALIDAFTIQEAFYDFTNAELSLYIDGVLSGASIPFSTAGNTTAANEQAARIGSAGTDSAYAEMDFAEIFAFFDLTTAKRERVYSYLNGWL